jgi:hypothetical protein
LSSENSKYFEKSGKAFAGKFVAVPISSPVSPGVCLQKEEPPGGLGFPAAVFFVVFRCRA